MIGPLIVALAVAFVLAYMIGYVSFERGRDAARREFVETMDYCVQCLAHLDASKHGPWEEGYKTAVEDIRNSVL